MSQEAVKALIEAIKTDEALQKKVKEAESPADRIRIINDAGFGCTAAEIDTYGQQLEEDDLECVAGGDCTPSVCMLCSPFSPF